MRPTLSDEVAAYAAEAQAKHVALAYSWLAILKRVIPEEGEAALVRRREARKICRRLIEATADTPDALRMLQEIESVEWEFMKIARRLRKEKRQNEHTPQG